MIGKRQLVVLVDGDAEAGNSNCGEKVDSS